MLCFLDKNLLEHVNCELLRILKNKMTSNTFSIARFSRSLSFGAMLLGFFLSLQVSVSFSATVLPFTPKKVDAISESWMWTEIRELNDLGYRCLTQGPRDSVFFGTENGIYHYDGHTLVRYGSEHGLDESPIAAMYTSRRGEVYAASKESLYFFNDGHWQLLLDVPTDDYVHGGFREDSQGNVWARSVEGVVRINADKAVIAQPFELPVIAIEVDSDDHLWLSLDGVIYMYECAIDSGEIDIAQCEQHVPDPIADRNSIRLYPFADSRGDIWVFNQQTHLGLLRYRKAQRVWEHFPFAEKDSDGKEIWDRRHSTMLETSDGKLVLASRTVLSVYENNIWTKIEPEKLRNNATNSISLFESSDRKLWVGMTSRTVFNIDRSERHFSIYEDLIFQDDEKSGVQWFIGKNNELVTYDPRARSWQRYVDSDQLIDTPIHIDVANDGRIIVAGSDDINAAISIYNGQRWHKQILANFSPSIHHFGLIETASGVYYLGAAFYSKDTVRFPGGVLSLTPLANKTEFAVERVSPDKVKATVPTLMETSDGKIWFGGDQLRQFHNSEIKNLQFPGTHLDKKGMIYAAADSEGKIWLSKFGYGVYSSLDAKTWAYYPGGENIGTNSITYILPHRGKLYAASFNGVAFFDGLDWNRHYLPEALKMAQGSGSLKIDGEQALWVNITSHFWFRRSKGIWGTGKEEFPPMRTIRYQAEQDPPIVELAASTDTVPSGARQFITWSGSDRWNYTLNDELRYSWRLDDMPWSEFSKETHISLEKLKRGDYTFELRAKDKTGNISKNATFNFVVLAPIWQRGWFIALVGGFGTAIITLIISIIRLREKQIIALEKVRLEFYTHITHELRTPLTAILGPLSKLKKDIVDVEHSKLISLAYKNSQRLRQLVDQVLDIRKIDSGKEAIKLDELDPVVFLRETAAVYLPLTSENKIQLKLEMPERSEQTLLDQDKLLKIVDNLLTNAVKFTPESGSIIIRVALQIDAKDKQMCLLKLEVEDNGIGISPEVKKHIFDTYYRGHDQQYEGFGIGLSYVKRLVDMCNGVIDVVSPVHTVGNPGTRFIVEIPLERVSAVEQVDAQDSVANDDSLLDEESDGPESVKPQLLIIEDNSDIRSYLIIELGEYYSIIEASNGLEGLQKAREMLPDVIISDVMMPEMDGLECCKMLKTDEKTSHIPIIVFSARRAKEHEIEGLETGADDYIAKPIDITLLRTRLHNLIESRKMLRTRYSNNPATELENFAVNNTDKNFIKRLTSIVEENYPRPDFGTNELAEHLCFSRTTLYRKMKAVFDQSPSQFIRSVRLQKAAEFLKSENASVSAVMYQVGFQDFSYFSKCFKAQYGVPPSQFGQEQNTSLS